MKQINCIAIDDEPIALLVIKQFCERKGNIELKTFCEPRIGLEEIKKDFPLLENRDIAYLDSGATTQKPKQVIEAIEKYYKNKKEII